MTLSETLIRTVALARWDKAYSKSKKPFQRLFWQANKIAATRKPLKRFQTSVCCDITGLKPGVNESSGKKISKIIRDYRTICLGKAEGWNSTT